MADNVAVYLFLERPHDPLDSRVPELADRTTARTNRVVMVLNASDAVHRGAIENRQLTKCACIYQVADCSVNSRPAHPWQIPAQLLGREGAVQLFNAASYGNPGNGPAQTAVFQGVIQVDPDRFVCR